MLKTKIFHFMAEQHEAGDVGLRKFLLARDKHDKEITDFVESLSKEGHTFINMNSVGYGRYDPANRIRTIIVYFENLTRKVLVEKNKR